MQFDGQKHQMVNRVMGGMARHPNIGAYLIIGLGCEQASVAHLVEQQQLVQIDGVPAAAGSGPTVMTMQQMGGTSRTVESRYSQPGAAVAAG